MNELEAACFSYLWTIVSVAVEINANVECINTCIHFSFWAGCIGKTTACLTQWAELQCTGRDSKSGKLKSFWFWSILAPWIQWKQCSLLEVLQFWYDHPCTVCTVAVLHKIQCLGQITLPIWLVVLNLTVFKCKAGLWENVCFFGSQILIPLHTLGIFFRRYWNFRYRWMTIVLINGPQSEAVVFPIGCAACVLLVRR